MTILRDLPLGDYFAHESASHSKLRDFDKSPRLYFDKWIGKTLPGFDDGAESSAALCFGTGFEHMLSDDVCVFGADATRGTFERHCSVKPQAPDKRADGRTVEGKAWTAANEGKLQFSHKEHQSMQYMLQSIGEHADVVAMLRECEQQVTFRRTVHGVPLQTRPDFVCLAGSEWSAWSPYTIDLKTTADLERIVSGRSIVDYGYHRQAAMNTLCMEEHVKIPPLHFLLVCEKDLPNRSELHLIDDYIPDALTWCLSRAEALGECQRANSWPRSRQGIIRLAKPHWLKEEWAA